MTHCWSTDVAQKYVDMGAQMILMSLDITMILNGSRSLKEAVDRIDRSQFVTARV